MQEAIRREELGWEDGEPIYCPICQAEVANYDDEPKLAPCEHTLFIAHDEGFEYRSPRLDKNLKIQGIRSEAIPEHFADRWAGFDDLTNKVTVPGSVKLVARVGAPSFFGAYYGFAPTEE